MSYLWHKNPPPGYSGVFVGRSSHLVAEGETKTLCDEGGGPSAGNLGNGEPSPWCATCLRAYQNGDPCRIDHATYELYAYPWGGCVALVGLGPYRRATLAGGDVVENWGYRHDSVAFYVPPGSQAWDSQLGAVVRARRLDVLPDKDWDAVDDGPHVGLAHLVKVPGEMEVMRFSDVCWARRAPECVFDVGWETPPGPIAEMAAMRGESEVFA